MRLRGINHVDIAVIDYDASIQFYDAMFGCLGYWSFNADAGGFEAVYYLAFPHSAIGVHRAAPEAAPVSKGGAGLHHLALWAKSRKEVDNFCVFLRSREMEISDPPAEYPQYSPGYYAVFFEDLSGIRWELAYVPLLPAPGEIRRSRCQVKGWTEKHPEFNFWRRLPNEDIQGAPHKTRRP